MEGLTGLAIFVESGFLIGGAGMLAGSRRLEGFRRKERWIKYGWYFLIVHAALMVLAAGGVWRVAGFSLVAIGGALEIRALANKNRRRLHPGDIALAFAAYASVTATALWFLFRAAPGIALYLYAVVAVLDAFSQIVGQIFGKTPLAPSVSPNKTREGLIGGAMCAIAAAVALRGIAGLSAAASLAAGLAVIAAGCCGDLAASWFKRRCGVKDYGNNLPGQGGFIDRFNSTLAVFAVAGCLGM